MTEEKKLIWLRRVLLLKVILTFFAWGLPALLGTEELLVFFNITMPENPIFLRSFGAAVTAFGVAYWFAYQNPIANRDILRAGVVDNGLVTLAVVYLALTHGLESWYFSISAVLTGLFCLAFIILMPAK